MDNYSLNDVKNLIDKNLINSDILKNILESTTRRIELYQDIDDINILKLLLDCKVIPSKTKEEIRKYLNEYEKIVIENDKKNKENVVVRRKNIIVFMLVIIALIILFCLVVNL